MICQLCLKRGEPRQRVHHTPPGRDAYILTRNLHGPGFGFQPRSATHFTRGRGLIFGQFFTHPGAFSLQHPPVEIANHAVEGFIHIIAFAPILKGKPDDFAARTIKDDRGDQRRQILPRRIHAEPVMPGETAQNLHIIGRGRVGFGPREDRAFLDAEIMIGDDEIRIEIELFAKAIAGRASALRGVETEQARFDFGNGEAGDGASEFLAEHNPAGGGVVG